MCELSFLKNCLNCLIIHISQPIKQWGFGEEVSIFDVLSLLFVKKNENEFTYILCRLIFCWCMVIFQNSIMFWLRKVIIVNYFRIQRLFNLLHKRIQILTTQRSSYIKNDKIYKFNYFESWIVWPFFDR